MGPIRERFEAALPQLREVFRTSDVVLAYLFGSVAENRERTDSDIDIAVLLDRSVPASEYWERMLRLNNDVIGLTHTNDVDVVILNMAPPVLTHGIISKGEVFLGTEKQRIHFEVDALKRFFDTAPMRRVKERELYRWIEETASRLGEGKDRW